MDLLGVLRSCLRRWYVFVPILALTAWLCASQYRAALPQYTATAQVVIAPSPDLVYNRGQQTESGLVVTSPFNGGGGPATLAGLLTTALNTTTVREQLLPEGGAALAATRNTDEDTTVVRMTVVAAEGERATASLQAVRDGVNTVLTDLQKAAGAPDGQLHTAYPAGPVDPPLVAYPDRVRSVVAIGLAGALLAVVLSVVVQALAKSRPKRRERLEVVVKESPSGSSPSAPAPGTSPEPPASTTAGGHGRAAGSRTAGSRSGGRSRSGPARGRRGASPLDGAVDLRESPSHTRVP